MITYPILLNDMKLFTQDEASSKQLNNKSSIDSDYSNLLLYQLMDIINSLKLLNNYDGKINEDNLSNQYFCSNCCIYSEKSMGKKGY